MSMIFDPTLEHYVYYLRRAEGDNRKTSQKRRDAFDGELRTLLAHLERLSGQTIPIWAWPQESEDRRISQRIVRTGWLDNQVTGRSCFVEARTYGDVYWLQVGYYQRGEIGPEIFASLCNEAWQPSATDYLLGSSSYLCGIAANNANDLAAQALTHYAGEVVAPIVHTQTTNGRANLYGSHTHPLVTALFYPNAEGEKWAGQTFLNDIAPRLELYKHKTDCQLAWCEKNWPILSEQEQLLRDLSDEATAMTSAPPELLRRFIRLYRVFNANVGILADRQTTIEINLDNLDVVTQELGKPAEDHFLGSVRGQLRRRQEQLEADLKYADHTRQQAADVINVLKTELGLNQLVTLQMDVENVMPLESAGWPGLPSTVEAEIAALTPRHKASSSAIHPQIEVSPRLQQMTSEERMLLQKIYRGFGRILVEKELGGGYSGTRVLLTLPVTDTGLSAARKITKLGTALELRQERDHYEQYVEDFLPFCVARVENGRYTEQNGRAGLNYIFVGGGALGQALDLEGYYGRATTSGSVEQIVKTLDNLLNKELGQHWYGQAIPLQCFFAAEYGPHLIEHVRLKLRPKSTDTLWLADQLPPATTGHRRIEAETIPQEHATIRPGTLMSVEGMVVKKIKKGEIKLQDPENQGIVVRVEFSSKSTITQNLKLGDRVGVRGKVVYNRRDRMEQIVRQALTDLPFNANDEIVQLPGVTGTYSNPLNVYPRVLGSVLDGRQSYVHGDLHLRNVLVDEEGKGWLIDFARVGKAHNLYDFIKLETYIRLMILGSDERAFSLDDYIRFEQALNNATLGQKVTLPSNQHLLFAYQVIRAIREIARKYMGPEPDFRNEYFPALFLYSLAVMKYYQKDIPQPTRLAFITACVLSPYIAGTDNQAYSFAQSSKIEGEAPVSEKLLGAGNRWAVLVGADKYDDRMNYGQLHVCVRDVHAIREQLVAGGFDSAHIHLLADDTDEKPTRAKILATLKSIASATETDDLLLFYYSGHGDESNGQSYLVAQDGHHLVLNDTALPVTRIKEIMKQAPAGAKVIVLDACHSGADIDGKGPKPMSADFIRRVFEEAMGLAIMASCEQGQVSYEWKAQEHSVFTHFILEALAGQADRDGKGFVTVQDANRHVTDGVKLWASQHNASQTPTLQYTVAGDIILVRYS